MSDLDDEELKATRRLNGADKKKTADEIFEELGYKKYDNHRVKLYYEEKGILKNGLKAIGHIEFDLIRKVVVCWAKLEGRFVVVPLSIEELKAINMKCEELGWI